MVLIRRNVVEQFREVEVVPFSLVIVPARGFTKFVAGIGLYIAGTTTL